MGEAARRLATYADVEAVPEGQIAEILAGELHTQPRPAAAHSRIASSLGMELGGPFDRGRGGPGGWVILDEPELHLGQEVLVPDLAGWRRQRLPAEAMHQTALTLAADWICEVLSPRTESIDRGLKMDIYAREGVGHLWLIQPLAQTLEVYRNEPQGWLRIGMWQGEATVRAEPFDAIEMELRALWSW